VLVLVVANSGASEVEQLDIGQSEDWAVDGMHAEEADAEALVELGEEPKQGYASGSAPQKGYASGTYASATKPPLKFTKTGATNRRAGYAEVVRYLKHLTKTVTQRPPKGGRSPTAMLDKRIQNLSASEDMMKDKLVHSKQMVRLLEEEKAAVAGSASFTMGVIQNYSVGEHLKQLHKAIVHEHTSQSKLHTIIDRIRSKTKELKATRTKFRLALAKKEARARVARLKKWSREKVDFNMWRAKHTHHDYNAFLKWKLSQKVKSEASEQQKREARAMTKVDNKLQALVRHEMTGVKQQVASVQLPTQAQSIAVAIKGMAEKDTWKRRREVVTDEDAKAAKQHARFVQDRLAAAKTSAELKASQLKMRHRLEKGEDKQKRLNTMIHVQHVLAQKEKKVAPMSQTEVKVLLSKPDSKEDIARLELKLKRAKTYATKAKRERDITFDTMGARVREDERRSMRLGGLEQRADETRAKVSAILRLQKANARMAKARKTNAAYELKAKAEVSKLSAKLKVARGAYRRASATAKAAKKDNDKASRALRIKRDITKAKAASKVKDAKAEAIAAQVIAFASNKPFSPFQQREKAQPKMTKSDYSSGSKTRAAPAASAATKPQEDAHI
jgi:hypothetical protein